MDLSELYNKADYKDNLGMLFCGDCLEIMKEIPDNSIDMILCDLPYGTTKCKWDIIIPFKKLWENYNRIIKNNGAIVLFGTEPFSSELRISNIKNYKYDWVWDKVKPNGHLVAKYRPMQRSENISVFGNNKINYFPIMEERENPKISKEYSRTEIMGGKYKNLDGKVLNKKYPQTILKFSNACQKNKYHPTQKPIELLEYIIKTYTNENMIVLDNCMGSGSTCVASKKLNRKYIGIEKEEKYFNIAVERLKNEELVN